MSTIAFVGVGRMGSGMAGQLIAAGHDVRVFDLSEAATAPAVALGATRSSSAAEAADGADFALLSLPNPAIVRSAVLGDGGVMSAATKPGYILDFSTVDPQTSKDVAAAVGAQGVRFLDTPVSGGVAAAATGKLLIMVGAEPADLDAARPVLDLLAARIVHCGPVGSGQLTKLAHNMLTAVNTVAAGEILSAAVSAGGDIDVLVEVFTAGLAGSKMLGHFDRTLFTEDRPGLFALDLMHKDISLFLSEFRNSVLPLSQVTMQTYNSARHQGLGAKDSSSVVETYENLYEIRLSHTPEEQSK